MWVAWDNLGTPPSCYHYQKVHREQAVQCSEQFCSPDDSVPALRSVSGHVSFSGTGIITLTEGSHTLEATPGSSLDRLLLHLFSPDKKPG